MAKGKAPAAGEALEIRVGWRRDDPAIEADAVAFWTRLALLPEGADPARRAKEVIAGAYRDGALVGLMTAAVEHVPWLNARMAVARGATDPAHRRGHVQLKLAGPSYEALRGWSLAHPEEKLAGVLAFIEPGEWGDFVKLPVWPEFGLELIGYTSQDQQVRARWFDHFRFD